ncbi:MAG TPA: hypothetical protein VFA57_18535 [Pseudolabrys sp.]|jgi:hypothetical protein|nr:hypothetical protein [Pseudolabrys sp.]
MTHKNKIVSAAAVAAVLLATVAVARTVHTHANAPQTVQRNGAAGPADSGPAIGPHNFACGLPQASDCQKVETWFPE